MKNRDIAKVYVYLLTYLLGDNVQNWLNVDWFSWLVTV